MTMNTILDMQNRTMKEEKVSTIIEWCSVLKNDETIDVDGYYPSTGYDYDMEFNIVRNELSKFPNIPKKYPIGNGKRNYLLNKESGLVLLNSGSREFQILVKFTDEYQAFREERELEYEKRINEKNKRTESRLKKYTGKILYSYKRTEMTANDYDSQEETILFTLKKGKVVDVKEIYSRDYSLCNDLYVVVDNGGSVCSDDERGNKDDIDVFAKEADNYIDKHEGYFRTDIGYWEVVQKWFDGLELPK